MNAFLFICTLMLSLSPVCASAQEYTVEYKDGYDLMSRIDSLHPRGTKKVRKHSFKYAKERRRTDIPKEIIQEIVDGDSIIVCVGSGTDSSPFSFTEFVCGNHQSYYLNLLPGEFEIREGPKIILYQKILDRISQGCYINDRPPYMTHELMGGPYSDPYLLIRLKRTSPKTFSYRLYYMYYEISCDKNIFKEVFLVEIGKEDLPEIFFWKHLHEKERPYRKDYNGHPKDYNGHP